MKYFKIKEFDSPDLKGSGKNMDINFLRFLDELRKRCGFPFRIGLAGKSNGNFVHIDIDTTKTKPRIWVY